MERGEDDDGRNDFPGGFGGQDNPMDDGPQSSQQGWWKGSKVNIDELNKQINNENQILQNVQQSLSRTKEGSQNNLDLKYRENEIKANLNLLFKIQRKQPINRTDLQQIVKTNQEEIEKNKQSRSRCKNPESIRNRTTTINRLVQNNKIFEDKLKEYKNRNTQEKNQPKEKYVPPPPAEQPKKNWLTTTVEFFSPAPEKVDPGSKAYTDKRYNELKSHISSEISQKNTEINNLREFIKKINLEDQKREVFYQNEIKEENKRKAEPNFCANVTKNAG